MTEAFTHLLSTLHHIICLTKELVWPSCWSAIALHASFSFNPYVWPVPRATRRRTLNLSTRDGQDDDIHKTSRCVRRLSNVTNAK